METDRRRFEGRLEKGDCFLLFSTGAEISFGERKVAEDLPLAVQILSSNRTGAEKADLLERMAVLPQPSPTFLKLVTQFQPSAQLTERLRALGQKTGFKPRPMEEIPAESPRAWAERMKKENKKKAGKP